MDGDRPRLKCARRMGSSRVRPGRAVGAGARWCFDEEAAKDPGRGLGSPRPGVAPGPLVPRRLFARLPVLSPTPHRSRRPAPSCADGLVRTGAWWSGIWPCPCSGEANLRRHGIGRGGGLAVAVAGVGAVASPPGAGRAVDGLVGAGCVRCGCSARWLAASPPRTAISVSSPFAGTSIMPGAGTASKGRPGWANRPRVEPMASRRCLSRRLSGPIGRGSRPGRVRHARQPRMAPRPDPGRHSGRSARHPPSGGAAGARSRVRPESRCSPG